MVFGVDSSLMVFSVFHSHAAGNCVKGENVRKKSTTWPLVPLPSCSSSKQSMMGIVYKTFQKHELIMWPAKANTE